MFQSLRRGIYPKKELAQHTFTAEQGAEVGFGARAHVADDFAGGDAAHAARGSEGCACGEAK